MQYRALVVFAALSVAAAGCAGGEGVEAEIETLGGAEEAMVDSNTLALPHDVLATLVVRGDEVVLPAAHEGAVASVRPGVTLLVADRSPPGSVGAETNPYGFLRRVEGLRRTGREIVVMTSAATLEDAIVRSGGSKASSAADIDPFAGDGEEDAEDNSGDGGDAPADAPAGAPTLVPLARTRLGPFTRTLGPRVLGTSGPMSVRLEQARFTSAPTVDTELRVANRQVTYLRLRVQDTWTLEGTLGTQLNGAANRSVRGTLYRNAVPLPPQQIGPIPLTQTLHVSVEGSCEASTAGQAKLTAGVRSTVNLDVELTYQDGRWTRRAPAPRFGLEAIPPTVVTTADGRLRCTLEPRIDVLFYNLVGPYVSGVAGANLTVDAQAGSASRASGSWALTGQLSATAGLDGSPQLAQFPGLGQVLSRQLARATFTLFSTERRFAGGTF